MTWEPVFWGAVLRFAQAAVQAALPQARLCLSEVARLMGSEPYLAGDRISLADLHLAPVFAYFTQTPDSQGLLQPHPGLQRWWQGVSARPSMAKTAPKLG